MPKNTINFNNEVLKVRKWKSVAGLKTCVGFSD